MSRTDKLCPKQSFYLFLKYFKPLMSRARPEDENQGGGGE
jgi:hypothetical protein